jgi:hypothetical protein
MQGKLLEITNLTTVYGPIMFKGLFGQGQVSREQILIFVHELKRWDTYLEVS